MACTPERSERIGELAGGRLEAAGAAALLAHVEDCAACSRELDLVADLLRAAPAQGLSARGRPVSRWVPWVAALAAAAAALLVFWLPDRGSERAVRDLAQLAPPPVTGLVLRGAEEPGVEASLDDALAAFAARDYALAAARLEALLAARADGPLALFYLGVARLQLGEHERALAALARSAERATGLLAEQALWYQAQARLARDEGAEARALLWRLVELDGDFEPNARALLAELEPLLER